MTVAPHRRHSDQLRILAGTKQSHHERNRLLDRADEIDRQPFPNDRRKPLDPKGTRFFLKEPYNKESCSLIRLQYSTFKIEKWLDFDPKAVIAWIQEVNDRLHKLAPLAEINLYGIEQADFSFAWIIIARDEGAVMAQCLDILDEIENDRDTWCPKLQGGF